MIARDEILLKRAVSACNMAGIDFERSAIEEFGDAEFVVLRSDTDLLSVFAVNQWQVKELEPEEWPDVFLDEAEQTET